MNDQQRAAMQMALEALKKHGWDWDDYGETIWFDDASEAIAALREALRNASERMAQPQGDEKQWLDAYKRGYDQGKFDLSMESQPQGERTDVMLCCPNCNTAVPSGVSIKSAYLFGGTAQEFALWLQDGREPEEQHLVAWMWQHDETGRIGFVDVWQVENNWQENNPRNRLIKPLYSPEAIEAAIEATKEKATKVCDDLYKHDRKESGYDEGWNDALDIAEQAIRSMK